MQAGVGWLGGWMSRWRVTSFRIFYLIFSTKVSFGFYRCPIPIGMGSFTRVWLPLYSYAVYLYIEL